MDGVNSYNKNFCNAQYKNFTAAYGGMDFSKFYISRIARLFRESLSLKDKILWEQSIYRSSLFALAVKARYRYEATELKWRIVLQRVTRFGEQDYFFCCFKRTIHYLDFYFTEFWCSPVWDTLLCWPPTNASSTAKQQCPSVTGFDTTSKCSPRTRLLALDSCG